MQGAAVVCDLSPGKPIRLVIDYGGTLRSLFWLSVGRDASVYAGLARATTSLAAGNERPVGGQATIRFDGMSSITDQAILKKLHLSFHSSGVINAGAGRAYRSPWRDTLDKPHQLCLVLFEHPTRFPVIPKPRKRDFLINYPIDEARPLQAKLFVSPEGTVVPVDKFDTQLALVFHLQNLTGAANMFVQVTLGHGVSGPWLPRTVVGWAAGTARLSTP